MSHRTEPVTSSILEVKGIFMKPSSHTLTIGEVAARSGVATSALRFYEEKGLISSERTSGNQRRYRQAVLRRIAVIRAAQTIGVSLREVRSALEKLPDGRTPNKSDWTRLSRGWRDQLEERIEALEKLKGNLTGCIGCGCLSLRSCSLFNRDDEMASRVDGSSLMGSPGKTGASGG